MNTKRGLQESLSSCCACSYITDEKYVFQTMVSIFSLVSNWNLGMGLNIYILCFEQVIPQFGNLRFFLPETVNLVFVSVKHLQAETKPYPVPKIALYKFDIPELINHKTILYLDGDTIVQEDLSSLFEQRMGRYAVGAVMDRDTGRRGCGVLIYNTVEFRRQGLRRKLWQAAKDQPLGFSSDKLVFNRMLVNDFFSLPTRYNFTPVRDDMSGGNEKAAILHYWGESKPWGNTRPSGWEIWEQYKNMMLESFSRQTRKL